MTASSFQYITRILAILNRVFFINLVIIIISIDVHAHHSIVNREIFKSLDWKNLLHYNGEKSVINKDSTFFLSSRGYINPKEEYLATLDSFFSKEPPDDNHAICKYPARFDFIVNSLKIPKKAFPNPDCKAYQEYLDKIVFNDVSVIFAAENNMSPSSMMGHSFLKIAGEGKEHAFSYFAAFDKADSLDFYIKVFIDGVDGAYILSPYREKVSEYLYKEKRSLWEFKLKLNPKEKERLKAHLWELKAQNIKYRFITHNCNTALINILKVANDDFALNKNKVFITPVEYIQGLQNKEKISNITFIPSKSQKNVVKKFGLNYIGEAPKPTKVSFSQDRVNSITYINFSPVYQDIRDVSTAYFPDLESKMLDLTLSYQNKKLIVEKIDILKMKSVIDYPTTSSLSKYFRLGFENDLFNKKTELKPVIEFGLGLSKKVLSTSLYILPKVGYHYDNFSNFYIAPQMGAISRIGDKIKIINSYEKYFNTKDNNIGFEEKYNFYFGYKVSSNMQLYLDYTHYAKSKKTKAFIIGSTFYF